ncbi:hypothetical protein [Lysobacter humi (ex Lee et al. 2017)]
MTTTKTTLTLALLAALGLCGTATAQGTRAAVTGEADARQSEQRSDNAAKGPVRPVLKENARGSEVETVRVDTDAQAGTQIDTTAVTGSTAATVPASANASASAGIATSAPGAMAAQRQMSGAGRYHLDTTLLDADRDGYLTTAEVGSNQTLTQNFATIDTDRDSRLAATELRAWIQAGGLSLNQRPEGRDFERGARTRRTTR